MPLLPLLGDYLQRFVQVLDLRADAQQILGFLDVAAALQNPIDVPSALRWLFGLVASIMELMSRSKISGWNTSSTRRKILQNR